MHIKFTKHGKGSAQKAVDYLLGEKDHKGDIRAEITVLRGNPDDVAAVSDNLDFKNKYKSAVIAWHPDDNPTDEQIAQAIDEFEHTAYPGIEPENRCFTAVLHRDDAGTPHVHIIASAVELGTGKSLNIAPPGWQKRYDLTRDMLNAQHGWASPDPEINLERSRLLSADPKTDKNYQAKLQITEAIAQGIEQGAITNRDDIVQMLDDSGIEMTRTGKNYITVIDPDNGSRLRLKGAIYEQSFEVTDGLIKGLGEDAGAVRSGDKRTLEELRNARESALESTRKYNSGKYRSGHEPDVGQRQDLGKESDLVLTPDVRSGADLHRDHRPGNLVHEQPNERTGSQARDDYSADRSESDRHKELRGAALRADKSAPGHMENGRREGLRDNQKGLKNERNRDAINRIADLTRRNHQSAEQLNGSVQNMVSQGSSHALRTAENHRIAEQINERIKEQLRRAAEATRRITERVRDVADERIERLRSLRNRSPGRGFER